MPAGIAPVRVCIVVGDSVVFLELATLYPCAQAGRRPAHAGRAGDDTGNGSGGSIALRGHRRRGIRRCPRLEHRGAWLD